jgi:long-chain acyl-CoA synthetase
MLEKPRHIPVAHVAQAPGVRTLGDMLRVRAQRTPNRAALHDKDPATGRWRAVTFAEYLDKSARVARGLVELGLPVGDRVAVLGPTQIPWTLFDFGAQLAGLVSYGIYPQQTVEQVKYLLEHSDTRVIFVAEEEELVRVLEAARDNPTLSAVVPWTEALFDRVKDRDPRIVSPSRFRGTPLSTPDLDTRLAAVSPDDTAVLIYTSGTTGPPKGAMISHRNVLSMFGAAHHFQEMFDDEVSLSFLPMAHAAERILACFGRVSAGVCTYYASSISAVLTEIREVRPTIFGSVPRIFEKAYAKIQSEVERKPRPVRELFAWAVRVGKERARYQMENRPVPLPIRLQYAVADRLVFRKIREVFGGRVRYFIVGAAPTPPPVLEFFWATSMPIFEVYGMTEATVITHANRNGQTRVGTVGRIIDPLEQRIADDGEVLLRGPWVFKGYYKNPEATAEILKDGWLHTGDIGVIDSDGYLRITDRKKHLIITSGGKNLAPANIEAALKSQDSLLSHVLAYGDRRNYVTALLVPSPIETLEWGAERGLVSREELAARTKELMANPSARSEALNRAMAGVVKHPDFSRRLGEAVKRGNQNLAHVESVRRFFILDRDLSQEHGELTPTLKVKRKEVVARYEDTFTRLYDDENFGYSTPA